MSENQVSRESVKETQQESATADQQGSGSRSEPAGSGKDEGHTGEDQARDNREKDPPA